MRNSALGSDVLIDQTGVIAIIRDLRTVFRRQIKIEIMISYMIGLIIHVINEQLKTQKNRNTRR